VNTDGVAVGNNMCSLSGFDLSKKWKNPREFLMSETY